MTYPLTPRADRLRVLRARRDQLDALIRRLEDAERQDDPSGWGDCGTETAYKRHRRFGERADLDCMKAHADYVSGRSAGHPRESVDEAVGHAVRAADNFNMPKATS